MVSARCDSHWLLEGATIVSASCFLYGRVDLLVSDEVWLGTRLFFFAVEPWPRPVIVSSLSGWLELPCLWEHRGKPNDTLRASEVIPVCTVYALRAVGRGQDGVLRRCFWCL